ncbi:hypothetical protein RDV64_17830 [Acuticoccus sp. MNP-M23]|uniref:hypothetical protein n=1 Tax=Acuticoccus sp. MNP-M23 TaxID=3072793 RepID=UPI0028149FB3|nr:hypothetical protein [Acuticoccus sp. MNP-M23]WMS41908.1 hypothetical protein RDV64_17830 [Acuticoccus sp. MNP-M23]
MTEVPTVLGDIDVAFLCVVAFVIFLFVLVFYLRREDKREGYPLIGVSGARHPRLTLSEGFPPMPAPKTFHLPHGRDPVTVPREEVPEPLHDVTGRPAYGLPLESPRPLSAGIGAAAFQAQKPDLPDLTNEGEPKLLSLNSHPDHYIPRGGADPRGWVLADKEGLPVGRIVDIWFNQAEYDVRYFSYSIDGVVGLWLAPTYFCALDRARGTARVTTLPLEALRHPPVRAGEVVTFRDEDRVNGFFAGGIQFGGASVARH